MIEYHANMGGFWYWILIKLCQTKLSDEQADKNRIRNLFFLCFINIIFVSIGVVFLINSKFF